MNPLVNNQNNIPIVGMQPQSNNTDILAAIKNSGGPQQLAQQIIQNQPGIANDINGMIQQCNAMKSNPRDYAINMLQQNGVPMDVIMGVAGSLGLK